MEEFLQHAALHRLAKQRREQAQQTFLPVHRDTTDHANPAMCSKNSQTRLVGIQGGLPPRYGNIQLHPSVVILILSHFLLGLVTSLHISPRVWGCAVLMVSRPTTVLTQRNPSSLHDQTPLHARHPQGWRREALTLVLPLRPHDKMTTLSPTKQGVEHKSSAVSRSISRGKDRTGTGREQRRRVTMG